MITARAQKTSSRAQETANAIRHQVSPLISVAAPHIDANTVSAAMMRLLLTAALVRRGLRAGAGRSRLSRPALAATMYPSGLLPLNWDLSRLLPDSMELAISCMLRWKFCVVERGDSSSFPRIMGGTIASIAIKPSRSRASISKPIPPAIQILAAPLRDQERYM